MVAFGVEVSVEEVIRDRDHFDYLIRWYLSALSISRDDLMPPQTLKVFKWIPIAGTEGQ